MNIQMKEIHRARYMGGAVSGKPLSHFLHVFRNPEALQMPYLWDFYGGFIM